MAGLPDAFLSSPQSIRRALRAALKDAARLDMAVAFVGKDWSSIHGAFRKPVRLVCWLTSTNTNPYAIEQMLAQPSFTVRQVDAMHAKVYLPRSEEAVAVVGSANLSTSALSDEEASGQFETAMLVQRAATVRQVSDWFEDLWRVQSRKITSADLSMAKRCWEAARRRAPSSTRHAGMKPVTGLPAGWKPSQRLVALARRIRSERPDAHGDVVERRRFFSGLVPSRMTQETLSEAIRLVAGWTGHIGAFLPSKRVALASVREAFVYAFDETVDVVNDSRASLRADASSSPASV